MLLANSNMLHNPTLSDAARPIYWTTSSSYLIHTEDVDCIVHQNTGQTAKYSVAES